MDFDNFNVGHGFLQSFQLTMGVLTMTITSITLGPVLAMIMLNMDENDGLRALQLTVLIIFGAALVGMYSGIDFSDWASTSFLLLPH